MGMLGARAQRRENKMLGTTSGTACRSCLLPGALSVAALFLLLPIAADPVRAQTPEDGTVTVDVAACFEIESAAARRECLANRVEDAIGRPDEATPNTSVGASPDAGRNATAAETTDTRAIVDTPAASPTVADAGARADENDNDTGGEEYFGVVTDLRERLPNALVITLDTGQVWQQTQPEAYPLRPGAHVRIYPTRWGRSYRLIGDGMGRHIQVRRVQ